MSDPSLYLTSLSVLPYQKEMLLRKCLINICCLYTLWFHNSHRISLTLLEEYLWLFYLQTPCPWISSVFKCTDTLCLVLRARCFRSSLPAVAGMKYRVEVGMWPEVLKTWRINVFWCYSYVAFCTTRAW